MSGSIVKLLLSATLLATASAYAATDVGDTGDKNFPVAGQENNDIEAIKIERDAQLQRMEEDYARRMEAINKRYTEKLLQAEEHKRELMKKRAEIAELNLQRSNKREELDKKMKDYNHDLVNRYEEYHNPFVEEMRKKGKSYGSPLVSVTPLDMDDQGGMAPTGDNDGE